MKGFVLAAILAVGAVCFASEPVQAQCANGSCHIGTYNGYVYGQPVRNVGRYIVVQRPVRTAVYSVVHRQPVRSAVRNVWSWRPFARVRPFSRVRSCVGGSCR